MVTQNKVLRDIVQSGANMLPDQARQGVEFLREIVLRYASEREIDIAEDSLEIIADAVAAAWSMADGFKRERDRYIDRYAQLEQAMQDPDGIEHPMVDQLVARITQQTQELHYECNAAHIAMVMWDAFGWEAGDAAELAYVLDNFESAVLHRGGENLPVLKKLIEELEDAHGAD